jgi:hypothetical protein
MIDLPEMSAAETPSFQPTGRTFRLWIDRCGGYTLLTSDEVSVGGFRPDGSAMVQVRADWRRLEGVIERRGGDYFWRSAPAADDHDEVASNEDLIDDAPFAIRGTAKLTLEKPSALSSTAVLRLDPPHRFDAHVDAVLLVERTIQLGPTASNHIRCVAMQDSAVIVFRDGNWRAKLTGGSGSAGPSAGLVDLLPGQRVSLGEYDMTLEVA